MLELDGRTLTFNQFRELCLEPNFPAIIRHAASECDGDVENGKQAFFVLERLRSRLAPAGLIRSYSLTHCVPTMEYANDASPEGTWKGEYMESHNRTLGEVMELWRRGDRLVYVKDWHMQSDAESLARPVEESNAGRCGTTIPKDERVEAPDKDHYHPMHGDSLYQVPDYLGRDWMDEFCRSPEDDEMGYHRFGDGKSDYRFVYIGPSKSWTPLHFDVFGTYSWSLNVSGEKLWFFPSPDGNRHLLECSLQGLVLPPDIRVSTSVELWTALQRPGDLVFVPSRYLHQVHNVHGSPFLLPCSHGEWEDVSDVKKQVGPNMEAGVELVISINHNWCNEWCIEGLVEAFCQDVKRIGRLLTKGDLTALFGDDITEWNEHVERMLIGGTNWNFSCIRSFLKYRLVRHLRYTDGDASGRKVQRLLEKCLERIDTAWLCITHRSDD